MRIQGVVCLKDAFRRVLLHPSVHEAETGKKCLNRLASIFSFCYIT